MAEDCEILFIISQTFLCLLREVYAQMVLVPIIHTLWPRYHWLISWLCFWWLNSRTCWPPHFVSAEDWDTWAGSSGNQQEGGGEEHAGYSQAGPSHEAEADIDDPDFNVSESFFDIQIILSITKLRLTSMIQISMWVNPFLTSKSYCQSRSWGWHWWSRFQCEWILFWHPNHTVNHKAEADIDDPDFWVSE